MKLIGIALSYKRHRDFDSAQRSPLGVLSLVHLRQVSFVQCAWWGTAADRYWRNSTLPSAKSAPKPVGLEVCESASKRQIRSRRVEVLAYQEPRCLASFRVASLACIFSSHTSTKVSPFIQPSGMGSVAANGRRFGDG